MRLAFSWALVAVVVTAVPSTAGERADGPVGRPCAWSSDFGSGIPESEHGLVSGGPYLASGTLTCTLRLNGTTHSGPADASIAYAVTGTTVTYLPPTPFSFSGNGTVVACTSFQEPGGPVLYWDPGLAGGHWTTDATARCAPPDPLAPEGPVWSTVDPVVCAVLGGDTYVLGVLFWDCPPYGT